MPRIPRRWKGAEGGLTPDEQHAGGPTPSPDPPAQHLSGGDPLAAPAEAPTTVTPPSDGAVASGAAEAPSETAPESGAAATPSETAPDSGAAATPSETAPDSGAAATPSETAPDSGAAATPSETAPDSGAAETPSGAADAPTTVTPASVATTESGAGAAEQPTVAAEPVPPAPAGTTSGDPLAAPPQPTAETGEVPAEATVEQAPADARPRFRQRTRMRRRLRYLRRLRELAFRDLGGLVFDLHRFGRDRNDLVAAKLEALASIDRELRTLQGALDERREFTDLREAGIAACPRCGTLHDTDANFCPGCGTSLRTAIVRDASPVTVTPADDPQPQPPTATGS